MKLGVVPSGLLDEKKFDGLHICIYKESGAQEAKVAEA
jgi:hypothetical protein